MENLAVVDNDFFDTTALGWVLNGLAENILLKCGKEILVDALQVSDNSFQNRLGLQAGQFFHSVLHFNLQVKERDMPAKQQGEESSKQSCWLDLWLVYRSSLPLGRLIDCAGKM